VNTMNFNMLLKGGIASFTLLLSSQSIMASGGEPATNDPVNDNGSNQGGWPADLVVDLKQAGRAITNQWIKDHAPEDVNWAWGEGVLTYGIARTADWTKDDEYRQWLKDYLVHHNQQDPSIEWSDHVSPAISGLYYAHHLDPQNTLYPINEKVVNYVMNAPRTEAQKLLRHFGTRWNQFPYNLLWYPDAWVDTLFHVTPTLTLYTQITGDNQYINEAAYQVETMVKNLQDPVTGLLAHAYDDFDKDEQTPAWHQDEFWARGNGWALVSMMELLETLSPQHTAYNTVKVQAIQLAQVLAANQGADGRYHTLVTKSGTYYETAATALIVYGFAKGIELGILDDGYRDTVIRGARGLLDKTLKWPSDTHATVHYTSIGTNPDPGFYRLVPRDKQVDYGVGAWLMMAAVIVD
jgi:rhamnogalacturonyl hydrolase YesR